MAVKEAKVKNGILILGGEVFSCPVTSAKIVPGSEGGSDNDTLETLCGDILTSGGTAESLTATLDLTAIQDWDSDAATSIVAHSWLHQGEQAFELQLTNDSDDKFTGKVVVTPLEIGGEVNTRITSDASWRITQLITSPRMGSKTVIGAGPAKPVVAGVTPATGAAAGSTAVVITGTGFTGATGVQFAGDPATGFTVTSDTEIRCSTPAHVAGAVDVTVLHPNGNGVKAGGFSYT